MFLWVDDNVGILFIEKASNVVQKIKGFIRREEPKKKKKYKNDDEEVLEIIISFTLLEG